MGIPFPTNEWVERFSDRLNASADYASIARRWEGDVLFAVEMPDGAVRRLYMDLWHGACREAYELPDGQEKPAALRLTAPLTNFVKVLRGQLDPMQAMMTGKLKVQGDMILVVRNIPTVLEFVRTAQQVETEFSV